MEVTLYSSPTCGYCHQAERFLRERGMHFTKYDVSVDRDAAQRIVQMTGQMGVPVIIVDSQVVVGFDRPRLEELLAKGSRQTRPAFGIRVRDASKVVAHNGHQSSGAYIDKVTPDSPSHKAGLRVGDVINSINESPIQNSADLANTIASLSGGRRISVGYLRGDTHLGAEIVI